MSVQVEIFQDLVVVPLDTQDVSAFARCGNASSPVLSQLLSNLPIKYGDTFEGTLVGVSNEVTIMVTKPAVIQAQSKGKS